MLQQMGDIHRNMGLRRLTRASTAPSHPEGGWSATAHIHDPLRPAMRQVHYEYQ